MPAYVVVIREEPLQNEAEYQKYQEVAGAARGDHALKLLAMNGAVHALEGAAPDMVVMLEFPTLQEARDWYESPGYQSALPHRLAAAKYRSFIFEGL